MNHIPVMLEEALEGLTIKEDGVYWDGTFGRGGHAAAILKGLAKTGRLIASDRDEEAAQAATALMDDPRFSFSRGDLETVIEEIPNQISGFLWDLGCSTPQLKDPNRGFSFKENGPLDMRMDQDGALTAADVVNQTEEQDLANLIYKYGEERFSRRIAARIVARRKIEPFVDTQSLADICRSVYPRRYHRIDPATRTFQALRIYVNDELSQLEEILPRAIDKLAPGGRAVIISFHSLEDRIVKHCFRERARAGGFHLITKKPKTPGDREALENPAARSAKLRVLAKNEE